MATTIKQAEEAIRKNDGLITYAARDLSISRQSLYKRIRQNPKLKEYLDKVRESTLDLAEGELFKAIRRGEPWAICFFLKCHGKSRGYVEKQSVEHSGNLTVEIVRFCVVE